MADPAERRGQPWLKAEVIPASAAPYPLHVPPSSAAEAAGRAAHLVGCLHVGGAWRGRTPTGLQTRRQTG